jgi:hypothetical protein
MKNIITTMVTLLALTGCNKPCERHHIELMVDNGDTVIEYTNKNDNIEVSFDVVKKDSTTTVECSAEYVNDPTNQDVPRNLKVKVCVNGKCGQKNMLASTLTYWPNQWDDLADVDKITCIVYQPEYNVCTDGFMGECYNLQLVPEQVLTTAIAPVEKQCVLNLKDPYGTDYCKGGYWDNEKSKWVCNDGWY